MGKEIAEKGVGLVAKSVRLRFTWVLDGRFEGEYSYPLDIDEDMASQLLRNLMKWGRTEDCSDEVKKLLPVMPAEKKKEQIV